MRLHSIYVMPFYADTFPCQTLIALCQVYLPFPYNFLKIFTAIYKNDIMYIILKINR